MLVLNRPLGKCVRIKVGDEVVLIRVTAIRGKAVKLGIECSDDVQIDRVDEDGNVEHRPGMAEREGE